MKLDLNAHRTKTTPITKRITNTANIARDWKRDQVKAICRTKCKPLIKDRAAMGYKNYLRPNAFSGFKHRLNNPYNDKFMDTFNIAYTEPCKKDGLASRGLLSLPTVAVFFSFLFHSSHSCEPTVVIVGPLWQRLRLTNDDAQYTASRIPILESLGTLKLPPLLARL